MRASKLFSTLSLSVAALAVPDDESSSVFLDKYGHTVTVTVEPITVEPETTTVILTPTDPSPWTVPRTAVVPTSTLYPYPNEHVQPASQLSHPGKKDLTGSKVHDAKVQPRGDVPCYECDLVDPPNERDEPALHLPRGDVPWWTNGQHEHPPRDEPCDPLSPTCHGHDENADAGSLGKAADDWTRWACTRGVQWACQYPDFGERDLDASPQHAPPTNCGYYNSRECVSAHAHQSPAVREIDASAADVDSATLTKRHDPYIPTTVGQSVTHHTFEQGQSVTKVFRLVQISPTIYSDTFTHAGSTHTVVISEVTGNPGVVVQTFIANDYTESKTTSTSDPASIGMLTSVDLSGTLLSGIGKREHSAAATPTVHASKGKPKHGKDESAKAFHTSDSKRDVPKVASVSDVAAWYSVLSALNEPDDDFPSTPVRRDVDQVHTRTILDEQPGHTTLNSEVVNGHPVVGVTVVDDGFGTTFTVSATTDAQGKPSLITLGRVADPSWNVNNWDPTRNWHPAHTPKYDYHRRPANKTIQTTVLNLYIDNDDFTIIKPTKSGKNAIDRTARVAKLVPSTTKTRAGSSGLPSGLGAPIPKVDTSSVSSTIDAPVPKVAIQSSGSTVLKVVTQIVTRTVRDMPVPTLYSGGWDLPDTTGWNYIMDTPLDVVKEQYPNADWEGEIKRLADDYQRRSIMNEDTSRKFAFIVLHNRLASQETFAPHSDGEMRVTQAFVSMTDGASVPMTAPTQTIRGTPIILDPLMKYHLFDAFTNAVAPTGSCHKSGDDDDNTARVFREIHDYNGTECAIERCMWQYMRPINITTAMPALMMDNNEVVFNYFTHKTHVQTPHWGTRDFHGLYYPTSIKVETVSGTTTTKAVRVLPTEEGDRKAHKGSLDCYDLESCHSFCVDHHNDDSGVSSWVWWGIGIAVLCFLLFIICCCVFLRRRRRDPQRRKSSLSEKLGRKPTEKQQPVVVNQVNGNTTDPSGRPVDPAAGAPATAAAAGPAAGAETAHNQPQGNNAPAPGDNGRGTTGRRAEEGRGRVNFADGEKPGAEGKEKASGDLKEKSSGDPKEKTSGDPKEKTSGEPSEKPSTEVKEKQAGEPSSLPATTEHAEPQPVPDKDGAGGMGTGRHQPDVGSMRGRKRNRPEGIAGLGF